MANDLKIFTLNVPGLSNKLKRKARYKHSRKHIIGIACLPETYVTEDIAPDME